MTPIFENPPAGGPGGAKAPVLPKVAIILLAVAVVVLLVIDIYMAQQVSDLRTALAKSRQDTQLDLDKLRDASAAAAAANRQSLDGLRQEILAATQQQSAKALAAARSARTDALNRADQVAKTLSEEQQRQQRQVASEISEVKQATSEAAARIGEVNTNVGVVRSEVAATKSELAKTVSDLKRMNGDMGVMSGLIATNAKELAALKTLADRNYTEFTLKKEKQFQKVGDIALKLNKTDFRKNTFTLELLVHDKRLEKKDRHINEPLQIYVGKLRQPHEVVVNEVKKDVIAGYLASPKSTQ